MDKRVEMLQKMYEKDSEDNSKQENVEFLLEGPIIQGVRTILSKMRTQSGAILDKLNIVKNVQARNELLKKVELIVATNTQRAKEAIEAIKDPRLKEYAKKELDIEIKVQKARLIRAKKFISSLKQKGGAPVEPNV